MAEGQGWQNSAELREQVRNMFSTIGQTGIVENAFQAERGEEELSNYNRRMSHARRWSTLLERNPATSKYQYQDVPRWDCELIPRGFKDRDIADLFSTAAKQASMDLKTVVGKNLVPDWHSPSPLNEVGVHSDMHLASLCNRTGDWGEASNRWLGMLLKYKNMVVKCRRLYGDVWYFSLSDAGAPGKFCWPAEPIRLGKDIYYRLKPEPKLEELPFLHVYQLADWEAMEVQWQCPLALKVAHSSCKVAGVLAKPMGKASSLIRFAASRAFYDIPKTPLQQLAKHLGCVFEVTDDLLARVQKLVIHVLGFAILFSGTPNVHVYSLVSCMFVASSVARAIPHLEAPPPLH